MLVIADQCDSSPCQNNSICVGGKCECLPGYSGENCKEGTFVIIKRINEWETWICFSWLVGYLNLHSSLELSITLTRISNLRIFRSDAPVLSHKLDLAERQAQIDTDGNPFTSCSRFIEALDHNFYRFTCVTTHAGCRENTRKIL